jgi:ferredoxin
MRISVDADQCIGHGRCYAASPDAYAADDEGYSADRGGSREITAGLEAAARAGAQACPAGAIKLTGT